MAVADPASADRSLARTGAAPNQPRRRASRRAAVTASLLHAPWHRGRSPREIVGEVGSSALHVADHEASPALIAACRELAPNRGGMVKPLRVLICGIPNVGKSTLINTLVGKRSAKTGDEAGVTRTEQRLVLADDFYLYDTPGMLWPRIIVPQSGFHLAASGAVGRNAYDDQEVALELLDNLKLAYPGLLIARYGFGLTPDALVEAVRRFEQWEPVFQPADARAQAERFSRSTFLRAVQAEVDSLMGAPSRPAVRAAVP